jgi:hypothetical protein
MVFWKKRSICGSLLDMLILLGLIMCVSFRKLCTASSRLLELGMLA